MLRLKDDLIDDEAAPLKLLTWNNHGALRLFGVTVEELPEPRVVSE